MVKKYVLDVHRGLQENCVLYDTEGSAARLFNTKPRSITPSVCVCVFYLLCVSLGEKKENLPLSSSPRALESCNLIFFLKTLNGVVHTHTQTGGVIPDGRTKVARGSEGQ